MGGKVWESSLKQSFCALWERGQSSTIGVTLLTAIVVILATLFGAFLFADFGSNEEQLLANVEGNVTLQGISLDHEGGDTFEPENVDVLLQGDTELELNLSEDFDTSDGAGQFAPGDEWNHSAGDTFYGGDFRLLVVHEPTNTVLLDQPHSLPITDMTLLVENWKGEIQSDRAEVIGNGSSYNFTVQVNAEDGQPPETVPLSVASNGPGTNVFELSTQDGGSVRTNQAGSGFNVSVNVSEDTFGMISMDSGEFTANWKSGPTGVSTEVELEAQLDESQFSDGAVLDGSDTTTVQVFKKPSVFTIEFAPGFPSGTDDGRVTAGYNVTNSGAIADDVNVTITYKNDTTDNKLYTCEVSMGTIDPGESKIEADEGCYFDNTGGEYGDINVTVSVPEDSATDIVTLQPPEFLVNITDAPSTVPKDSPIRIDANVTNAGGVVDDQTITLSDDEPLNLGTDTETVTLLPGESTLVEGLELTSPGSTGPVTVNVSSEQDYSTTDVEVQDVLIPIQSYEDWDLLNGATNTDPGASYTATSSPNSTSLPPGDDGSGRFEFGSASGAVVWEDLLADENWIRLEYNSNDLGSDFETNVSIGGMTRWSSGQDTGGGWEHRLIDVAGDGDNTKVGLGGAVSGSPSCLSSCTLYYDNVTFVNHSLPLQTESDWERTAGTFDGPDSASFGNDTTTATNGSASGQFDITGTGTGTVAVREQLSEREYLTVDHKLVSGSLDSLDILANGTVVKTVNSASGSWTQESVFLDGYGGNTRIAFRAACSGGCTLNLDNVTLSPPPASIPITTEQDWTNASSSFETSDDAGTMAFEVNDTVANVSGASGRFTAGEFANGVARVTVTEDLSGEDAFSFDYKGSDLGIAQVAAVVTVDNDTVWTSNGDPGGWTTEQIDVSDYTGPNNISFEMQVSTETLNEEQIFFDNVVWDDLPNNCKIDKDSYDGNGNPSNFDVEDGDLSRCALEGTAPGSGTERLFSSEGLNDPEWFDPPEGNDYPDRGGQISYSVKTTQSNTDAMFSFGGDDPSLDWYQVRWSPDNEELTVSSTFGDSSKSTGGKDGTGDYYRIIVDWDLNEALGGAIYARAVNSSGDTVAYAHIQDESFDGGPGDDGHIGFGVEGDGKAVWDNLRYGETDFETVLPSPGESYYINGIETPDTYPGPSGLTHNDGWIHDRLPVEEGETRTYSYYADYDSELLVSLRNGTATETDSLLDIENEIHTFPDRLDYGGTFRSGYEVMVSLTIDYTDESEIEMRAKAVTADGFTRTLNQTWSGASSHDEVYVSTYEYDGTSPPSDDSLRLIPDRVGQFAANGFPLDDDVQDALVQTNGDGFDHLRNWVDRNDPTRPGGIVTIPYYASSQSEPESYLTVQVRDEPASDQTRGRTDGPSQHFKKTLTNFLKVYDSSYTILVKDYSVTGEVFLRAVTQDSTPEVVGERILSIPDSAPADLPVYISTYEETDNSNLGSIRYSPF